MLRPLARALCSVVALALFLGCSGLADLDLAGKPPPSAAWVGRWEGPGMVVQIDPAGTVSVSRKDGGSSSQVSAPAQAWASDHFDVGLGSFTTRYRVDESPYERDGVWRMVVEGVPLERVPGTEATTPGDPSPEQADAADSDRPDPLPPRTVEGSLLPDTD